MSQKRHPEDRHGSQEKKQKVPALREVIMEALRMDKVQKLFSVLEPLVRRVVKEEVERALAKHFASMKRQCGKHTYHYPSNSRSLQLQFVNKLSLPIFTGTRVEGEDCSAIKIALVDACTGQVVVSGPESSLKIELVALEGDFEGDENGNWTLEEFKNNIVREREGKGSLLACDAFLDLNDGIGIVRELSFTDNSSWTRSRKFRLAARVVDGYFNGERVREAKTDPFMVKDHRGELYRKHYPPLLWDEVWRLEKIGKEGAFHKRLASENINSVKDFLTLLTTDAPKLRNILGNGMSAKMWEFTVEHAQTCRISNQLYVYFANNAQQRNIGSGVVFNVVGEVMGLLSENRFIPINDLPSESEKADARILVKNALEHWDDVLPYDGMLGSCLISRALPTSFSFSNIQSDPDNIYNSTRVSSLINDTDSFRPDSFIRCTSGVTCSDDPYAPLQATGSSPILERISDPLMLDESGGDHTLFSEGSMQQYIDADVSFLSRSLNLADSPADLSTAVTGFLAMSARSTAARMKKADTVWGTLLSVLRWRFSIKKIVAMKRIHQSERSC